MKKNQQIKVCQIECDACKKDNHQNCLGVPENCICGYWGMEYTNDIQKEIGEKLEKNYEKKRNN